MSTEKKGKAVSTKEKPVITPKPKKPTLNEGVLVKKTKKQPTPAVIDTRPALKKPIKKEKVTVPKKEIQKLEEKLSVKPKRKPAEVKREITDVPTSSIQRRRGVARSVKVATPNGYKMISKKAFRNRKYQQIMKSHGLQIPSAIFRRDWRKIVDEMPNLQGVKLRPHAARLLQYSVEQSMKNFLASAVLLCYQGKRVTLEKDDVSMATHLHTL
jgi:histone H3/H4